MSTPPYSLPTVSFPAGHNDDHDDSDDHDHGGGDGHDVLVYAVTWFAVTGIVLVIGLVILWWRWTCSGGVVRWNQQIDLACSSHWPHLHDDCDDDDCDYDDENDNDDENYDEKDNDDENYDENDDETFMMVALSSRSAWSISALSRTLIFKLSLRKVKMILPPQNLPS